MMTPVLPFSFEFTADGTSTALSFDLTTAPTNLNLRGAQVAGVQSTMLTLNGAAEISSPLTGATISVVGTRFTFTFPNPLPKLDTNSVLIVYGISGVLQLAGLPAPATV